MFFITGWFQERSSSRWEIFLLLPIQMLTSDPIATVGVSGFVSGGYTHRWKWAERRRRQRSWNACATTGQAPAQFWKNYSRWWVILISLCSFIATMGFSHHATLLYNSCQCNFSFLEKSKWVDNFEFSKNQIPSRNRLFAFLFLFLRPLRPQRLFTKMRP